ncbi:MAG: 4-hydroxy-tetrahydrodipicolinate reductase [Bacteroidales bacterium]|nr:4-hydroxy-tetrahydrodipicolinate reductase [Bacteroidales bacterium]
MKIALLGYGRMGHEVAAAAEARGHKVAAVVDCRDDWAALRNEVAECDVAIDFSLPNEVLANIDECFALDLPAVVGTTGWYDHLPEVASRCREHGKSLFVASNFSMGMNVVFELNRRLAELMERIGGYDVAISETHHIHKLDAPSGTAISLASDILNRSGAKSSWALDDGSPLSPDVLRIRSIREGEVAGIHEVTYTSPADTITLRHEAHSRAGLAAGAILAAEFLLPRKGFFTMHDMLQS